MEILILTLIAAIIFLLIYVVILEIRLSFSSRSTYVVVPQHNEDTVSGLEIGLLVLSAIALTVLITVLF